MKYVVVLVFGMIFTLAVAEPLRYRQPLRASARQTDNGVAFQATLGETTTSVPASEEKDDEPKSAQPAELPAEQPPQVPYTTTSIQYWPSQKAYYPKGWKPVGQLLVLPFAVRENVESTATVESTTFNDAETTEATPTTEPTKGELETSEPKSKKTAAYTKSKTPLKFSGELKVETKDAEQSNEEATSTTENNDEATTTEPKSGDLETTSEPESETVDAKKSNGDGQQSSNTNQPLVPQQAFYIQLPDGTLQRIVYLSQPGSQAAFTQQPANVQIQQLNQSPNYPFGFNPIANPRIVTFSTQYHAF